jgi:hypothetical protein
MSEMDTFMLKAGKQGEENVATTLCASHFESV